MQSQNSKPEKCQQRTRMSKRNKNRRKVKSEHIAFFLLRIRLENQYSKMSNVKFLKNQLPAHEITFI